MRLKYLVENGSLHCARVAGHLNGWTACRRSQPKVKTRLRSCLVHTGKIDDVLWRDRYVLSFSEPSTNVINFEDAPRDIVVASGD